LVQGREPLLTNSRWGARDTSENWANNGCSRSGHYFTPSKIDSRKYFNNGETKPDLNSEYGATI